MDVIKIEIVNDDLIKVTTDPVSGPNHMNAEEFLNFIAKQAGGKTTRRARGAGVAPVSKRSQEQERE